MATTIYRSARNNRKARKDTKAKGSFDFLHVRTRVTCKRQNRRRDEDTSLEIRADVSTESDEKWKLI